MKYLNPRGALFMFVLQLEKHLGWQVQLPLALPLFVCLFVCFGGVVVVSTMILDTIATYPFLHQFVGQGTPCSSPGFGRVLVYVKTLFLK